MATKVPHYKWIATSGEGDFAVASNWDTNGVPTDDVDAMFQTAGTFQCDITTAVNVEAVEVKVAGATLVESGAGFITAQDLIMTAGRLELDGPNDFHYVLLEKEAVVALNDANAFGPRTITTSFAGGGALEFTASMTFHPMIGIYEGGVARIGASAGHTVNLAGEFSVGFAPTATEVDFGGDGDTGTVKLAGKFFAGTDAQYTIDILSGTVMNGGGAADVVGAELFAQAQSVGIASGATLDVRNFGADVTLSGLSGKGTVLSRGNDMTITNADFFGHFSGNPVITATGDDTIDATFGHAMFTMGAGTDNLRIEAAIGKVSVSAPMGSTATVLVGPQTPAFFTDFSAGHVTIDALFADHHHISYSAGSGFERATVHLGGGEVENLYLYGVTSPSQVHVVSDGNGGLLITYAAAEIAAHQSFVPMPHDAWF